MNVGRDSFLVVVKVQEKILLLGVSPSGIEKLDKLDSYEKMEPAEAPPDFVAVLSSQLKARRRGEDDGMKKGVRVVKLCDTIKQIPSRKMTAEGSGLWNKITMW